MPQRQSLVGRTFTRLEVIADALPTVRNQARSWCLCTCGTSPAHLVCNYNLLSGHLRSCGCLRIRHGHSRGYAKTKTYSSWHHMLQRCLNPKYDQFYNYGGRGITVCERWQISFHSFLADMGECPPLLELDRIDNERGYSKENCRWATRYTSSRNKRSNRWFTVRGHYGCLKDLADMFGNVPSTIVQRMRRGWDVERAFCEAAKHR